MNVLDVGAHIGYFSRLFSRLVGPKGRVYAFEPHEPTHHLLCQNLSRLRCRNVVPVQMAVADRCGQVEFFEMSASGKHGLYNVSEYDRNFIFRQKLSVESTTLDCFLADHGNPEVYFIKMDIEGSEPCALKGMRQTIARSRRLAMVVELNGRCLRAAGITPEEYLQQLCELGFDMRAVAPGGTLIPVCESVYALAEEGYINLFCTKQTDPSPSAELTT